MSGINLTFKQDTEFCGRCGAILPIPNRAPIDVACECCQTTWKFKAVHNQSVNTQFKTYVRSIAESDSTAGVGGDSIVGHICPKCDHGEATYTTRQTRSADEGQTVFYTCTKCKSKSIEYS
uniref:DNA-directed RNA polymerase subunit n=1 Tax=Rhabditophanes sp. KR3021 TaxID=114890 RepID=A0AC35TV12_9BILA